jgi:hypothetical protein
VLQDQAADAAADCTAALELKPKYVKVLLRRCAAFEKLDKLDEALAGGPHCAFILIIE